MRKTAEDIALSAQELKMISGSEGPCISILQPVHPFTPASAQKPVRLKKAIQSVEQLLENQSTDPSQKRDLLEPLYEFEANETNEERRGSGFVLFRSPRMFRYFYVSSPLNELVTVASHFYILPLLPLAAAERSFYILSLSQKNIRLLRCTNAS